jgi:hypothetical protein
MRGKMIDEVITRYVTFQPESNGSKWNIFVFYG